MTGSTATTFAAKRGVPSPMDIRIERLRKALETHFAPHLDMTDCANLNEQQLQDKRLSRALAAFSLTALADADPVDAAAAVTDGWHDKGIDAIYFDQIDRVLYFVQSKWSSAGTASIDQGDWLKFKSGVLDILQLSFVNANDRIRRRKEELTALLYRSDIRITLVPCYAGQQGLGPEVIVDIANFLADYNSGTDQYRATPLGLDGISERLADYMAPQDIDLEIALHQYRQIDKPIVAKFGYVPLVDIAAWRPKGARLFDRNLRGHLGPTNVNRSMCATILESPDKFWYFNNGITILCKTITPVPVQLDRGNTCIFRCTGVSVINGAQTVGAVWDADRQAGGTLTQSAINREAKVHVRIISTADLPQGFSAADVTRATNTQNQVLPINFYALDQTQRRLAREFAMEGKVYEFRSGEESSGVARNVVVTAEEATIALACAVQDLNVTVQAKREMGKFYEIEGRYYQRIFPDKLTTRELWNAVHVLRVVERELDTVRDTSVWQTRRTQIAFHGNRLILNQVFRSLLPDYKIADAVTLPDVLARARIETIRVLDRLEFVIANGYPNAYLQPLFKKPAAYETLVESMTAEPAAPTPHSQGNLFARG